MEEWKRVSIYLILFTVVSAISDVLLSYFAYVRDPLFFVQNEANEEAVMLFHYGQFPFEFVIFHVLLVGLSVMFFSKYYHRKTAVLLFVILVVLAGCGHILGGLTWFDQTGVIGLLFSGIALTEFAVMVSVFVYFFFNLKNRIKERRELNRRNRSGN